MEGRKIMSLEIKNPSAHTGKAKKHQSSNMKDAGSTPIGIGPGLIASCLMADGVLFEVKDGILLMHCQRERANAVQGIWWISQNIGKFICFIEQRPTFYKYHPHLFGDDECLAIAQRSQNEVK
jgi:hypothetical protein